MKKSERSDSAQEMCDLRQEAQEIAALRKRTDLKCPYCTTEPTTVAQRGGELLPCKKCRSKRANLNHYDMSLRQFADVLRQQDYSCAICGERFDYTDKATSPNVDQCDLVGHVRGVLCGGCKAGLGYFKDDHSVLANACKYLIANKLKRIWWILR